MRRRGSVDTNEPIAVVLLSGRLDSTTTPLAFAQSEAYAVRALPFRGGSQESEIADAAPYRPAASAIA